MLINEGIHDVDRIVGCFCGASKEKGTPYFGIDFLLENGEEVQSVHYLTDKTQERNLKTLLDIGFIGKKIADLADTKKSIKDLFLSVADLNVTIVHEEYPKNDGTTGVKAVVQWVNVGHMGAAKMDHKEAVATFKGFSFDGELMKMKKSHTAPALKPEMDSDGVETVESFDEIPF